MAGSRGSQIFLKAAGGEMEVRRRSAMRDLSPKAATGQELPERWILQMSAMRDAERPSERSERLDRLVMHFLPAQQLVSLGDWCVLRSRAAHPKKAAESVAHQLRLSNTLACAQREYCSAHLELR